MSFNPNQGKKFAEVLKETPRVNDDSGKEISSKESSNYIKREKRRPYTFSLMPSARTKLTEIAKEHGYSSSSSFLNDVILEGKLEMK